MHKKFYDLLIDWKYNKLLGVIISLLLWYGKPIGVHYGISSVRLEGLWEGHLHKINELFGKV